MSQKTLLRLSTRPNGSNHLVNWNVTDMPSQMGRVSVVTGANSGIGWHTALELARAGSDVILTVRSKDKGRTAMERIRRLLPRANPIRRQLLSNPCAPGPAKPHHFSATGV